MTPSPSSSAAVLANPATPDAAERPSAVAAKTRVLFVCNSLAMGRDGVGDYVRLLARECGGRGLDCALLALHDLHVTEAVELGGASGQPPTLRLPATMPWPARIARAIAFREQVQPGWISLQFVPYGFNSKGIVWNLGSRLAALTAGLPLHVMFHELWIGGCDTAAWKERGIGWVQKMSVVRLIRRLAPALISTSNATYVKMLAQGGVAAQRLPLFGNIPLAGAEPGSGSAADSARRLPESLLALDPSLRDRERDRWWVAVFFGTLHPEWDAEPLFSILQRAATAAGRRVCFVAVGRLGAAGDRKWRSLATAQGDKFHFVKMGEQLPERVSRLFQAADFGIAASPWHLIGKSGSAMAMLEHGLPVIANRDNWRARDFEPQWDPVQAWLHRCDAGLEAKLVNGLEKPPARCGVAHTADEFIQALRSHGNPGSEISTTTDL